MVTRCALSLAARAIGATARWRGGKQRDIRGPIDEGDRRSIALLLLLLLLLLLRNLMLTQRQHQPW